MSQSDTSEGPSYGQLSMNQQTQRPQDLGYVWQPWAMGGGEWVMPKVVRLSDEDVERIARRVMELLKG